MTCSTHSIEWYDIDIIKTFHSIYRSRMVASRSYDTDHDGKTEDRHKTAHQVTTQKSS